MLRVYPVGLHLCLSLPKLVLCYANSLCRTQPNGPVTIPLTCNFVPTSVQELLLGNSFLWSNCLCPLMFKLSITWGLVAWRT